MAVYAIAAVVRFKRGRQGNVLQHFEIITVNARDSAEARETAIETFRESFAKTELARTGWYILRAPKVIHLSQEMLVPMLTWSSKSEPKVAPPTASAAPASRSAVKKPPSHLRLVED